MRKPRLTEHDFRNILEWTRRGYTWEYIGRMLNREPASVRTSFRRWEAGDHKGHEDRRRAAKATAILLSMRGKGLKDIAKAVGLAPNTANQMLARAGLDSETRLMLRKSKT